MPNEQYNETIESLVDLIDSGKFQRADELIKTRRFSSPLGRTYQAEVHTYFNRLEEAGELLKQLRPQDLSIPEGARYFLALGEWHYWRFEYEAAEKQFHIAEWMYQSIDDEYGLAKALYNLGRLQRRLTKFEVAQETLKSALDLVKEHRGEKKDYLKALIDFNLGVCALYLGQLDKASDLFASAMVMLNKLEHGMYYAGVLTSYGMLLMRKGLYEESLSVVQEAAQLFERLAAFEPLGAAMNNMALTLIRLQRFAEAEKLLQESLELFQRAGYIAHVSATLETFAKLSLELPDLRKAEKYATEAMKQAELSRNDFVKAQALIAVARVALKRNDFYAATKPLKETLKLAKKLNNQVLRITALIYLAEAHFYTRPVVAQERLTRCRRMLEDHPYVWLSQEIERITQKVGTERIRITADNWLMINGNLLPNWYAVKEALETFLVKNALRQSGGNMTKAGKLLGTSKVHARDKRLKFKL